MSTVPPPTELRPAPARSRTFHQWVVWGGSCAASCLTVATAWYLIHGIQANSRNLQRLDEQTLSQPQPSDVSVLQLGVVVEPLSTAVIEKQKLGNGEGVMIREVIPNTPGTEAGLQVGDVILVVGNHPIATEIDFDSAVHSLKAGVRKPIEVVRDGYRMTLHLKVDPPQ